MVFLPDKRSMVKQLALVFACFQVFKSDLESKAYLLVFRDNMKGYVSLLNKNITQTG